MTVIYNSACSFNDNITYQTKNIAVEHKICHQLAHVYDKKREIADNNKVKTPVILES